MVSVLAVLSSAVGPVIIGMLIDRGLSIQTICILIASYIVFANILLVVALRTVPPSTEQQN